MHCQWISFFAADDIAAHTLLHAFVFAVPISMHCRHFGREALSPRGDEQCAALTSLVTFNALSFVNYDVSIRPMVSLLTTTLLATTASLVSTTSCTIDNMRICGTRAVRLLPGRC